MTLTPKQQQALKDVGLIEKLAKDEKAVLFDHIRENEKDFADLISQMKAIEIDFSNAISDIELLDGKVGEKGDKGDKGDTGERGTKGENGKTGNEGRKGIHGIDGLDGRDGEDGKDGKDGIDGKDGKDGEDGSPDTPEEIKEKLETLKGRNRLDAKAIKNLPSMVQSFSGGTSAPTDHSALSNRDAINSHPASAITNTPAGNISSTNVQDAIDELDTEKVPYSGASQSVNLNSQILSNVGAFNSTKIVVNNSYIEDIANVINVVAGTGIEVGSLNKAMLVQGNGGSVTVTATPSIAAGSDGEIITLIGNDDAKPLILQDDDTLSGSNLKFSNSNRRVLKQHDRLTLQWDGTNWVENCFAGSIGLKKVVLLTTGSHNLTAEDSGAICTGTSNNVQFNLPAMEEGMYFSFYAYSGSKYIQINANGTDRIRIGAGSVTAEGGYIRSALRGSSVSLWGVVNTGIQWQKLESMIYGWNIDI